MTKREEIVDEARSWIGTAYHSSAMIKGHGCDCLTFLVGVYSNLGLISKDLEIPAYPFDWFMHKNEKKGERYIEGIVSYFNEIDEISVLPGDLVLFRFGHYFSHGGIVTSWPNIIHSYAGAKVREESALETKLRISRESVLPCSRPKKFFTLKEGII